MLSLNSVSAWIEVDGKELEQYSIEEDPGHNQVTCWIATQADKSFSVVYRDDLQYRAHSLASSIQLDGSLISGKVLRPSLGHPNIFQPFVMTRTVVQNGQVVSAMSSRPFLFSKLELTDEDEYLNQSSTKLGEIHIRIYRAEILQSSLFQYASHASGHAKVHERSKKAVTHCVSYGQEVRTPAQYSCVTRYLDGNIPLVTFVFKYRDLGLLQANGIAPKPPPPERRATVSRELLDLTIRNDVKPKLVDRELEIIDHKRPAAPTKRSKSSHDNAAKPAKRIKRENKLVSTGEVIDLT